MVKIVKVFAHSDDEWSFSENDANEIEQENVIDDGSMILDGDQLGEAAQVVGQNTERLYTPSL